MWIFLNSWIPACFKYHYVMSGTTSLEIKRKYFDKSVLKMNKVRKSRTSRLCQNDWRKYSVRNFGCERYTFKKANRFKHWCLRLMLRITWRVTVNNETAIRNKISAFKESFWKKKVLCRTQLTLTFVHWWLRRGPRTRSMEKIKRINRKRDN